jgi:hypothetical protein
MTVKRETTMRVEEGLSGGEANLKLKMWVLDWVFSCSDERLSSDKKECASEGAAKWARCLPKVCEHKCLATKKRGRGSDEGVDDLISDSGTNEEGSSKFSYVNHY